MVVFAQVKVFVLCLTLTPLVPVAAARCLLSSEKAKATLLSSDQREKNPAWILFLFLLCMLSLFASGDKEYYQELSRN